MKGNTQTDVDKTDVFNKFMIDKGIFILDETGQVIMNPNPVMIGENEAKFEYTLAMAIRDFKTN